MNKYKIGQEVYLKGSDKVFKYVGEVNSLPMVSNGERSYLVSWEDLRNGDN